MTHYVLPTDYIASCGCTAKSTHYPTAALSQMAFGSSAAYESKSVIVKVTDKCPLSKSGWCNGTVYGNNIFLPFKRIPIRVH
ncbi:hypothetical protein MPER_07203, partial [Moniliophthora perniciosa FA553]